MRKTGKNRTQKPPRRPLWERTTEGLRYLDDRLGIDPTDYGAISPDEIQKRVDMRIKEQDNVILPARRNEGKLTPAWEKYAEKRNV